MKPLLEITGLLLIALALLHAAFPKRFDWKRDLASTSLLTRQIFYVHTFFVALVVFLMGLLCLTSARDLLDTALGKKITAGFCVFWCLRLLVQWFGYSPQLWRGKVFETAVHILFSAIWIYLTLLFGWVAWG